VILVVAGYWGVNKFLIKESQEPEVTRKMLAVLPFENLGSPEDEYFADGITDEITGKLASIRDLGVISRTSTVQYKRTTKNLKQIAKELGVDYILEGSIRWDKGGTTSRVRILPQLIRVSDDTHLWAETFQRPLTDIFEIQADIADRIAAAMSIALGASEGAALRTIPTDNLEAYQAYLEGVFSAKKSEWTKEECLAGVAAFQRAVDLDSTFALAYARLSVAHSRMFHAGVDRTPERLHMAKSAVDRALELQPGLGWAHIALYYYHYWGFLDYEGALRELSLAENARPNDPELADLKGYIHRRQGKTQEAVTEMERAFRLNPRSATLANEIAWTYLTLRQYASADRYSDISTSLEPSQVGSYTTEAWVYLFWRGDTASARKVLAAIPDQDNDETHVAWYDYCILTRDYKDALRHLAYLPDVPHTSIDIFSPRALMEGVIYWCMNDRDRARAAFDSARMILESELVSRPDDHRIHSALGFAYAGLGRKQDAIREGIRGVELYPVSKDAYFGPQRVDDLADIYVMVGQYDEALEQFEYLLSIPYGFSVEWLRLDPRYDPLRDLPRYQKLVEKYGT
jgi:TolB-like protein